MATFPTLSSQERERLLAPPSGQISMVLDTDTYNEVDDQFALVHALLSPNLDLEAVYAAPFSNERSSGPADGMEKSYQEILRLLDRMGHKHEGLVFRGSESYLPSETEPVLSPAAEDTVAKAMRERDRPLYVLAIGAITNVASAILLEPEIIKRIVVVWMGGDPYYFTGRMSGGSFNLIQDVAAARVVFNSGVPMVHIPSHNVSEHMKTTLPELAHYVKGQGVIGDYLYETFRSYREDHFAYSKEIWDMTGTGYLVNPEWVQTELRPSPVLLYEKSWGPVDPSRHLIREATRVNRDAIFGDFFRKLQAWAAKQRQG